MSRFEEPFNDDEESLAEGCTKDLLEGYGASEDHQTFIAALRAGGLSEATAKEVHRRTMTHPEAPNMKTLAAPTQAARGEVQQAAERLLAGLAAATVSDHGYHGDIRTVIRAALAAPTQAAGAYCGFCGGTDHKAIDCLDTHCPVEERAKRIAALAAPTQAAPAAQAKLLTEYQIDQVFNWHNRVHGPVNTYTAARRFASAIESALAAAPAAAVEPIRHDPTEVYEMPFEARARRLARERAAAVPEGLTTKQIQEVIDLSSTYDPAPSVPQGIDLHEFAREIYALRPASDDAKAATRSCPWCGARVPEDDDCPQPPDVCHHEVVIKDQAAKG